MQRQGLDSLMAVELKNHLENELGTTIPVVAFFEEVTVRRVAELLVESLAKQNARGLPIASPVVANGEASVVADATSPVPATVTQPWIVTEEPIGDVYSPGELLSKIDRMSDAEVDRLLLDALHKKVSLP